MQQHRTNPLDAINDQALTGPPATVDTGGYIDLRRKGDSTTGRLVAVDQRTRMWEGQVVQHRGTGEARIEWVVTLTDGTTTWMVVANESMQAAITSAIRTSGQRLAVGDVLTIEVIADPPSEMRQARYAAKVLPAA